MVMAILVSGSQKTGLSVAQWDTLAQSDVQVSEL